MSNPWLLMVERAEFGKLHDQGTFEPVDPVPGRSAIKCRFEYAKKTDSHGNLVRYKARLVAQGFRQVEVVDYEETSSQVLRTQTMRLFLAIMNMTGWIVLHADADNAFVQAKMPSGLQIYVAQPEGCEDGSGHWLLLRKALYGLK
ncbi:hypothetical protein LEN26_020791 [Aphanomyces euteiches]|nr:hypothetical protein LEN26_020791 [Aphanomyces euteiches]KAH9123413.1 hypothetical protein AeMF1_005589 [Aphanomyces euteiches]KAH9181092.1 hypothetical protein AeNC1_016932 [Aphanomyces euteiches]